MLITTTIADILGDEYTQLDPDVYRAVNAAAEEADRIFLRNGWTWAGREMNEFSIMAMLWQLIFSCLRTLHENPNEPWTQSSSGRLMVTVSRTGSYVTVQMAVHHPLSGKPAVQ